MKKWNRGGKTATPTVTETITRVCVPCVVAYTVIDARVHRLDSSKHVNPVAVSRHRDQRKQSRPLRLTMICDPSRRFSSTEMSKNVPTTALYTFCWVSCMEWVARRSTGDFAEFIGQSQCTNGCTDTENDGSIGKNNGSFLHS